MQKIVDDFRFASDPGITTRLTGRAKSTVGHEGLAAKEMISA
jgi:hypothetical protein